MDPQVQEDVQLGFFYCIGNGAQRYRRCFLSRNLSWRDTTEPAAVRTHHTPMERGWYVPTPSVMTFNPSSVYIRQAGTWLDFEWHVCEQGTFSCETRCVLGMGVGRAIPKSPS